MDKKTFLKNQGKILLLGNDAVVRGALEAGVSFASTFPGTPSSEIGDTFSEIAKDAGLYFEYSTNEKVALEAAIGASLSGLRSIVSFKHFGLNVASDSFMPSAYIEPEAGFVVVVADDPQCWSSVQSEQDSRYYARMSNIPMLEPATPQEAKDFTKEAFLISEKFGTPILIRLTTRVDHTSSPVKLEKIKKPKTKGEFKKDFKKYFTFAPRMIQIHKALLEKLKKIENYFEGSKLNYIENNKKSEFGIITSGVSFCYIKDVLDKLNIKIPVLKIGTTYPLPEKLINQFIKNKKTILIVEELEPILENEIRKLAKDTNCELRIEGKNLIPRVGELRPEIVERILNKLLGRKPRMNFTSHTKRFLNLDVLRRFPVLCPGCPHRATFFAVKSVAPDAIFGGDIGCYMLGAFPPFYTQDFMYDMGAGMGIIHGIKKATGQKTISFIGDSTFFHAGIPGLINAVYNKSNSLIMILDNRITAMTGHQPNPGMGKTGMGEKTTAIKIEDIARACGVKNVKVVSAYNIKEMKKTVKEFLDKDEFSVIVAKGPCILLRWREMRRKGEKIIPYQIDQDKCKKCGTCVMNFACPAIKYEQGKYQIDKDLCSGCGSCAQVCPFGAIKKSSS